MNIETNIQQLVANKKNCKNRLIDMFSEKIMLETTITNIENQLNTLCPHQFILLEIEWDGHRNNKIHTCKMCKCYLTSWQVNTIENKKIEY
jgi:hypothetical protein